MRTLARLLVVGLFLFVLNSRAEALPFDQWVRVPFSGVVDQQGWGSPDVGGLFYGLLTYDPTRPPDPWWDPLAPGGPRIYYQVFLGFAPDSLNFSIVPDLLNFFTLTDHGFSAAGEAGGPLFISVGVVDGRGTARLYIPFFPESDFVGTITTVPEPATSSLLLLGVALVGALALTRRTQWLHSASNVK